MTAVLVLALYTLAFRLPQTGWVRAILLVLVAGLATGVHPSHLRLCAGLVITLAALKMLRVSSARELSMVMASVGLAQNFAAVRALGSVGIQQGHMALHARCVAVTAGARGHWVEKVANALVTAGHVKVDKAQEILALMMRDEPASAVET